MNEKKEPSLHDLENKRIKIQKAMDNPNIKGFLKVSSTGFLKRQLQLIEKQIQEHPEKQVEEKEVAHCGL